ncbi:MAG: protein-methionine-sulfoxide reductase heme-binding subunit MsrQ [Minicystis sp.]
MPAAKPKPILFPAGPLPWLKPAVLAGGLAPLAGIAAGAARGTLGANPIAEALNELGLLALIFLVASLACTPAQTIAGWKWPIRIRKTLGLLSFFYAALHLITYAAIDQALAWKTILEDIAKRPFIMVGFAAFLILVPLAVTSTSGMLKRLGAARWKRLHRLAYVAAVLAVTHFVLRVKKDVSEPAAYGAVLGVLFLIRIVAFVRERRAARPF